MSKKSRQTRRRSPTPRLSPAQLVQPHEEARPLPVREQPTAKKALSDLRQEYRYVVADLKRIAIIAGVMMAVMIGLALVLI